MTIDELLATYRAAAAKHGRATQTGAYREANKAYRELIRCATRLRQKGADAQAGWTKLLDDDDDSVRVWAASHILEFAPDDAARVLRSIANGNPGPDGLNAEMVLREWKAGRLQQP